MNWHHYLSDRDKLVVSKVLARALGVGPSIILKRIQHWIEYNEDDGDKKLETHFHNGRWWMYNTLEKWEKDVEIFSADTIGVTLKELEDWGLILSSDEFNKWSLDRTKWYTIDYAALGAFLDLWTELGRPKRNGVKKKDTISPHQQFINLWIESRTNPPIPRSSQDGFRDHPELSFRDDPGDNTTESRESNTKGAEFPQTEITTHLILHVPTVHSASQPVVIVGAGDEDEQRRRFEQSKALRTASARSAAVATRGDEGKAKVSLGSADLPSVAGAIWEAFRHLNAKLQITTNQAEALTRKVTTRSHAEYDSPQAMYEKYGPVYAEYLKAVAEWLPTKYERWGVGKIIEVLTGYDWKWIGFLDWMERTGRQKPAPIGGVIVEHGKREVAQVRQQVEGTANMRAYWRKQAEAKKNE